MGNVASYMRVYAYLPVGADPGVVRPDPDWVAGEYRMSPAS